MASLSHAMLGRGLFFYLGQVALLLHGLMAYSHLGAADATFPFCPQSAVKLVKFATGRDQ